MSNINNIPEPLLLIQSNNRENKYAIETSKGRIKMILLLMASTVNMVLAILLRSSPLITNFTIICNLFCFYSLLKCELSEIKMRQDLMKYNQNIEQDIDKMLAEMKKEIDNQNKE
ncbi:MAG: hypothetical protein J5680_04000 [Neisseriaceae bacterium]|nr:hypothetical protein [Neisseriaceae bacterium]MBR5676177.1 hypothetical protein [Neisseriaceae bacterium]